MLRSTLFTASACAAVLLLASVPETRTEEKPKSDKMWVFIGTYTPPGGKSKGIYRCDFDASTGKLGAPELAAETKDPSFLAIHPTQKFLYAVGEGGLPGKKGGGVSAFSLDAKTGELKLLNQDSSVGAGPCHIVVDRSGKNALVANYGGGSVAVLPIGADGKLSEASAFIQHKGADPAKKVTPHGHSINVDAANRFAIAADLGLNQLLVYKFDADKGTLTPNDPPFLATAAGAGPRHFAFHPNGKWAYVINETNMTIDAMSYDAEKGVLKKLQTVPTLPKEPVGKNFSTAEVVVHPSGKFVYGSNRGHHSIVGYAIDEKTGELKLIGHQGEGIKTPRNFNIDPTGQYMLVGNQDGASVIVYRIDAKTGELKPTGTSVEVGAPVCIKFVPKG